MKLVELNYHCHTGLTDPREVIGLHALSSGYIEPMKQYASISLVKHMSAQTTLEKDGLVYHFLRSRNHSWYIPFSTHRLVKQLRPDVVLVQGFVFPLQVMALRRSLGKKVLILAQHHGERPFSGMKRKLQRYADKSIDAYLFTSKANAKPWLDTGVIRDSHKCLELLSASSSFTDQLRKSGNNAFRLPGNPVFLWVGRLNAVKDPLTVTKAFLRYLVHSPGARLYFIYQDEDMLPEIQHLVNAHPQAKEAIQFCGRAERHELEQWYNAADFFILGSHREGSGYALAEAMACGCIPLVTRIPSFQKMTAEGSLGLNFEAGNEDSCYSALMQTTTIDQQAMHDEIARYASRYFTYRSIAADLYRIILQCQDKVT